MSGSGPRAGIARGIGRSTDPDIGRANNLTPFRRVFDNELAKFARCHRLWRAARIGEL